MKKYYLTLAVSFVLFSANSHAKINKLPKGYRNWTHTKSMIIPDKSHGLYGFHNIYANQKALRTMLSGKKNYPVGAGFVVSFYELVKKDGTLNQGKKIMDAVMIKDKKAKTTNFWSYAAFGPTGKAKPINQMKDCHECHKDQKANDYVFHKFIR